MKKTIALVCAAIASLALLLSAPTGATAAAPVAHSAVTPPAFGHHYRTVTSSDGHLTIQVHYYTTSGDAIGAGYSTRLEYVTWRTAPAQHDDRITVAFRIVNQAPELDGPWVTFAAWGGLSTTHNDIATKGTHNNKDNVVKDWDGLGTNRNQMLEFRLSDWWSPSKPVNGFAYAH